MKFVEMLCDGLKTLEAFDVLHCMLVLDVFDV